MSELNDHQLLAEFVQTESEEAFATLVARHVNLVYSAALRFTDNPAYAEEITQAVFIIFARKAGSLGKDILISGWLYQTARLTAANFRKVELRRQRREHEAYMQSTLNESSSNDWERIAPWLDEAMGELNEVDRNAIVLSFFENKTLREVAEALRMKEPAAHKRITRAVEKLRKFFVKRGVATTTVTILGAVSANSVQTAPAGLIKTISVVAATKGATATASTLTLVKGISKLIAWTKIKTASVVGACAVLTVATATVIIEKTRKEHPSTPVMSTATVEKNKKDDSFGLVMKDVLGEAFADVITFPELTNSVPVNGHPKIQKLLSWVIDDFKANPGKADQQVSYSVVLGAGEGFAKKGDRDLSMPYVLRNSDRSASVVLIARPDYPESKKANLIVTYKNGGELLDRKIALQWIEKRAEWGGLKESGPSLTNNLPAEVDPKIKKLLSWLIDDFKTNPGKSEQQVSYSVVIGAGEGSAAKQDDRDLSRPYVLESGGRRASVAMIVRPNYSRSKEAYMMVTYNTTGKLLDRKIALQWIEKRAEWGGLKESGPSSEKIR